MRLTLALILTLLSACTDLQPNRATDRPRSLSAEERAALYDQALAGARRTRERYIATTRPALQLMFRQEHPTMTEAYLDLLVNDALEKGLRPETGRRPDGPIRQPQMDCMSSPWRNSAFANCY